MSNDQELNKALTKCRSCLCDLVTERNKHKGNGSDHKATSNIFSHIKINHLKNEKMVGAM